MKLLYIVNTSNIAGTEIHILNLCLHLSKNKMDITVICPKGDLSQRLKKIGVKIENIDINNNPLNFSNFLKIIKIIKERKINIIHAHLGKGAVLSIIVSLITRRPVITTKHFIKPMYCTRGFIRYIMGLIGYKLINALSSRVIAVSDSVRRITIKRENINPSKILTIYNGTDLKAKEVKINSNSHKIGVISRLSREKGINYLIDAMPSILKKFPNAECLIAGIGSQEEELKDKVSHLGLKDKIKFLGFVDNIEKFLAEIDIFVLPSLEESFGITLVEAMMAGKPVIATKTEGAKEVITDNTGILVEKANSSGLAKAVINLFKDSNKMRDLALLGQKRAIEFFTAKRMAKETKELYESLLNPSLKDKKKKVLVIGHHLVTESNQRRIEEIAKYKDLDITLLTPKWWNEESRKVYLEKDYDKNYAIYSGETLFTGHNALCFYITSLFKLLWMVKPEIIDVYEEPWSLTTLQVILFKKLFLRRSKIMFYSAQNINKGYPFFFRWLERFTFRNADYAYPCSKGVIDVLRTKGYKNKIKVVPLGLDIEADLKKEDDVFTPLEKIGTETKKNSLMGFTIGYVGRFVKSKGILDLIEAVSKLDSDFRLLLVGGGPLKSWITNRAKDKRIEDKIVFAGSVPRSKMPQYYAKMDALVVPSRTTERWKEQFGRIITEAMGYGVAVVGSDSGSIPEVTAGCGLIFKEGNIDDLKEKIVTLRDNKELRDELIKKGREYAQKNYTWTKVASMVHDIYDDLSKKRILFLDHMSKPSGGELYLLEVLKNINKDKCEVKVLLGKGGFLEEKLRENGINVDIVELPDEIIESRKDKFNFKDNLKELFGLIKYAFKVRGYIKRNKIDIIYSNSIKSDIYGALAAKLTGMPCIWHLHDRIDTDYFPKNLCKFLIFLSKHFVYKVICNSQATKEAFVEAGGERNKALIALNGIDIEKFNLNKNPSKKAKKIAMLGRISPWKGQKIFIEAAREVVRRRQDVKFYIAGSVLFGEDDYKEEIKEMVSENGLSGKLEFLDFIEDVPSFLSTLDILVHASVLPEPFGLSVAEGMAAGIPVVACRDGGILEMIKDKESGLLYEPGNYKELADDILKVLNNKELASRLGNNAKETIKKNFDIKNSVKKIDEVLNSI